MRSKKTKSSSPKSTDFELVDELQDDGCVERRRDKRFRISDEDKSVIFLNPNKELLTRTRIDGCVVREGIRADWVVSHESYGHVVVEFKGHDIDRAYAQICATASLWKRHRMTRAQSIAGLIICNRVPKVVAQTALQRKFLRDHQGQFKLKSYEKNLAFTLSAIIRGE